MSGNIIKSNYILNLLETNKPVSEDELVSTFLKELEDIAPRVKFEVVVRPSQGIVVFSKMSLLKHTSKDVGDVKGFVLDFKNEIKSILFLFSARLDRFLCFRGPTLKEEQFGFEVTFSGSSTKIIFQADNAKAEIRIILGFDALRQMSFTNSTTKTLEYEKQPIVMIGSMIFNVFVTEVTKYLRLTTNDKISEVMFQKIFVKSIQTKSSLPIKSEVIGRFLELYFDMEVLNVSNQTFQTYDSYVINKLNNFYDKKLELPLRSLRGICSVAEAYESNESMLFYKFHLKGTGIDIEVALYGGPDLGAVPRISMCGGLKPGYIKVVCAIDPIDILGSLTEKEIENLVGGVSDVFSGYYQLIQKYRQNLSSKEEVW